MKKTVSRRHFIKQAALGALGIAAAGAASGCSSTAVTAESEPLVSGLTFTPGTYTASATGKNGPVTVTMTFDETRITDVVIDASGETAGLGDTAAEKLAEMIQAAQTCSVDTVSGATVTSDAIKTAAADCMSQASGTTVVVAAPAEEEKDVDEEAVEIAAAVGISAKELAASEAEACEITSFAAEYTADVVVVGAGTTGIPAALAAIEAGASVIVLQKQDMVNAQGMLAARVVKTESDPVGIAEYVHELHATYDHRGDLKQHWLYANRSQEALEWFEEKLAEAGFTNYTESDSKTHVYEDGNCHVKGILFSGSMQEPMSALVPVMEEKGVEFFFGTPAVQLIKKDNAVVGVVGKNDDGYIRFTANKGVILATGDYQNNDAMVDRYTPDASPFPRKQANKTGDGHLIGMLAGAQMEKGTHCKMVHGGGASVLREEPLLALNLNGERFMYEDIEYGDRATVLRDQPGNQMVSIFDANYSEYVYGWGSDPTVPTVANASPEKLAALVEQGVTLKADTLEELFELAGMPVDTAMASVKRYNELCAQGQDLDFGKASKYMKPVDTAPFYAQPRKFEVSALPAGLIVNENGQCLDKENAPIPGLFAAGNCSGCFYGDNDYSLSTMGLSIGRCITFGYLAGSYVAQL